MISLGWRSPSVQSCVLRKVFAGNNITTGGMPYQLILGDAIAKRKSPFELRHTAGMSVVVAFAPSEEGIVYRCNRGVLSRTLEILKTLICECGNDIIGAEIFIAGLNNRLRLGQLISVLDDLFEL